MKVVDILFSVLIFLNIASGEFAWAETSFCTDFDKLINENKGEVPTPFSKILKRLKGPTPQLALIPDGRSLQRKEADFHDPRIILNSTSENLFIGYAPNANQLEVITWNQCTGQYDFLVVKNYEAGKKPIVSTPERAICLACHQNEAPIFARQPWREVYQGPEANDAIRQKILNERNSVKNYFSIDLDNDIAVLGVIAIDDFVRKANQRVQSRTVCREMCKDNISCRKQLLQSALLKTDAVFEKEFQAVLQGLWPANGFAYPSSVIPDRDPLLDPEHGGTAFKVDIPDRQATIDAILSEKPGTFQREHIIPSKRLPIPVKSDSPFALRIIPLIKKSKDLTYEEELSSGNLHFDGQTDTVFLASEGTEADPKVRRPLVNEIPVETAAKFAISHAFSCLGFTDFDRQQLVAFSDDQIKVALEKPEFKVLLENWPVSRGQIMLTLLKTLGTAEIPACYVDSRNSQPLGEITAKAIKKIANEITKVTKIVLRNKTLPFQSYCAKCHTTDEIAKLPLRDIKKLKKYVSPDDGTTTVLDKLKDRSMPPEDEAIRPTESEYEDMIRSLEK